VYLGKSSKKGGTRRLLKRNLCRLLGLNLQEKGRPKPTAREKGEKEKISSEIPTCFAKEKKGKRFARGGASFRLLFQKKKQATTKKREGSPLLRSREKKRKKFRIGFRKKKRENRNISDLRTLSSPACREKKERKR